MYYFTLGLFLYIISLLPTCLLALTSYKMAQNQSSLIDLHSSNSDPLEVSTPLEGAASERDTTTRLAELYRLLSEGDEGTSSRSLSSVQFSLPTDNFHSTGRDMTGPKDESRPLGRVGRPTNPLFRVAEEPVLTPRREVRSGMFEDAYTPYRGVRSEMFNNAPAPRREVRPETFDGRTCDWTDFIVHFEQVSKWNDWNEMEKAQQLGMCLRGDAQKLLGNLTMFQLSNYLAIKDALSQRYNPVERGIAFRNEFRNRRQGREESISEYGFQLRRLASMAYPTTLPGSLEVQLIDQFLHGLNNFEMKRHVAFAHPTNLDNAISHALEFESVDGGRPRKPVSSVRFNELESEPVVQKPPPRTPEITLEAIASLIDTKLETFRREMARPRTGPARCYVCQEVGHFRNQCPLLRTLNVHRSPTKRTGNRD